MNFQPVDLTFIIPFYNGEAHINKLINSILLSHSLCNNKLVLQFIIIIDSVETSYIDLENLLKNNLSPDFNNHPIIIKKNEVNLGVAKSRNIGLDLAAGAYCIFIDQDDEVSIDYLSEVQPLLYRYDFILVNGFFIDVINKFKYKIFKITPKVNLESLILDDFIRSPGQVVLSKKLLNNAYFPEAEHYYGADDRFFWIIIFLLNKNIRFNYLSYPLFLCMLHENNYSNNSKNLVRSCLELWEILLGKFEFSEHLRTLASRNILLQNYLLYGMKMPHNKLQALTEFVKYKFKLNKILRFGTKKYLLLLNSTFNKNP